MNDKPVKFFLYSTFCQKYDSPKQPLGEILVELAKEKIIGNVPVPIDFLIERSPNEMEEYIGIFGAKKTRVKEYGRYHYYLVFKAGTTDEQLDYWRMYKVGVFTVNQARY
jgi:hypothetical protein